MSKAKAAIFTAIAVCFFGAWLVTVSKGINEEITITAATCIGMPLLACCALCLSIGWGKTKE